MVYSEVYSYTLKKRITFFFINNIIININLLRYFHAIMYQRSFNKLIFYGYFLKILYYGTLCIIVSGQSVSSENDRKKYRGPLPNEVNFKPQLASGLNYIQSQNIIHGNVKWGNILIFILNKWLLHNVVRCFFYFIFYLVCTQFFHKVFLSSFLPSIS